MTKPLRSRAWFDNPDNPDMTALYLERYLNYGLTLEELRSGKPIIGIAQTGSDLAPCNRHHIELAQRVREGIREAAATVDIPAIALSVGPMLNGWLKGERIGSGTIIWKAREMMAAGELDYEGFIDLVATSAPSVGYCNTMGTATTMNSLAEALGMSLPGSAAIPAPYRERPQVAYMTGKRIVEMVHEDLKPSDILTADAFHNAIVVNSAIGGSTNAPIHITALARHSGVELPIQDWQTHGHAVPLLVNLQPAGKYLGEDFHQAGGVPAVISQLMRQGLIREAAMTVNGRTMGDNCKAAEILLPDVIRTMEEPLVPDAGFLVLTGNIFDSAIMKTSVIATEFRDRYLSNPEDPNAFEGPAVVFDGPEDYHHRIDDPATGITERSVLFMRGAGPIGYPGAAEVVNMRPPAHLIRQGVTALACIGDGRQSGTSGSPSILNASPEAAAGGNMALLRTGDPIRVDLNTCRVDVLISDAELAERRAALDAAGGFAVPPSQTPWQELQRDTVGPLSTGAVLEPAVKYHRIIDRFGNPRDNH